MRYDRNGYLVVQPPVRHLMFSGRFAKPNASSSRIGPIAIGLTLELRKLAPTDLKRRRTMTKDDPCDQNLVDTIRPAEREQAREPCLPLLGKADLPILSGILIAGQD